MLNEKKIRLMTKLALFEDKDGTQDIKHGKFYRNDYVRLRLLQTMISVTLGFGLVLVLVVAYKMEYLVEKAVTLDYATILKTTLGIFIIVAVIYIFLSMVIYSIQYDRSRKKLGRYMKNLKELRRLYKEGEGEIK